MALSPEQPDAPALELAPGGLDAGAPLQRARCPEALLVEPGKFSLPELEEYRITFTPDGNTAYFASDRSDGLGSFDLWRTRCSRGEVTAPTTSAVPRAARW